jgi:hypothetical protein
MTMSTFVSTVYRDLTCALAAAVIAVVASSAFVESTAVAPTAQAVVSTAVAADATRA